MDPVRVELTDLLLRLEAELRNQERWAFETPPIQALQSQLPFCCDTLKVEQWLEFIFLPTMYELIENQVNLPTGSGITAYVEESLVLDDLNSEGLLVLIHQIDEILN